MDNATWESICKKCGKCCYFEIIRINRNGHQTVTNEACDYLDKETNLCTIYGTFKHAEEIRNGDCVKLTERDVDADWLPEDCGYVEYFKNIE